MKAFPIWKKYGAYNYCDAISERLRKKYLPRGITSDWMRITFDAAWNQHKKQIIKLCGGNEK